MRVERSVVVERPVAEVFAYLTDLDNLPEWQREVVEVRRHFEGEPAVGATYTEARKFLGRRIEQTLEVAEYEAERLFTVSVVSGPVPFRVRHAFGKEGGGTRIDVVGEGEPGPVFRLAEALVVRRVERQFEVDFDRLKQVLESR